MNARIFGLIGVMAAVGAATVACHKDPTSVGVGTPTEVLADFDTLAIDSVGHSARFVATVVDANLTQLTNPVSVGLCSGGSTIASVVRDTSYHPVPNTSTREVVTGLAVGSTCVVVSSSGLKPDSVHVTVLHL